MTDLTRALEALQNWLKDQKIPFMVIGGIANFIDLVIHKAISERERDWEDIEGILIKQGKALDRSYLIKWLKKFSHALEKPGIIKRFEKMWAELLEVQPS